MSDISNIISKVQKLLNLTKSSNANEAANAAALANKLIDLYRLSSADLGSSDLSDEEEIVEDEGYIYETGRVIPWKNYLAVSISKHYGCAIFNQFSLETGRKVSRYKLVGLPSDMNIAKYMFTWLSSECQRLSELEARGKGHVFAASYCQGFVSGVMSQLSVSREEAKKSASSSAIVKIDNREKNSNIVMNNLHNIKKTKAKSKVRIDSSAFNAGLSKGKDVGKNIISKNMLT